MKLLKTVFCISTLLSSFTISSAAITAVDFGASYLPANLNTATPTQLESGDYNFDGSATDRAVFVPLGTEHMVATHANWVTPEGKTGPVIRYGVSIANIGSTSDPSIGFARFNSGPDTLQSSNGAGTATMRMASAWYWEKSSFLNGADTQTGVTFANQAGSLTADFLNGGNPSVAGGRQARFMIQNDGVWYLSGPLFGGTTGTLTTNAAEATWYSFDPVSASLLFYDSGDLGTGVSGSEFTNITAIGVHVQHELFDGLSQHAANHQLKSLEAVVIPEPATISALLGLGALAFVVIRRRVSGR